MFIICEQRLTMTRDNSHLLALSAHQSSLTLYFSPLTLALECHSWLSHHLSLSKKFIYAVCADHTLGLEKKREIRFSSVNSFFYLTFGRCSSIICVFLFLDHHPSAKPSYDARRCWKSCEDFGLSPVPKESLGPMNDGLRPLHH